MAKTAVKSHQESIATNDTRAHGLVATHHLALDKSSRKL